MRSEAEHDRGWKAWAFAFGAAAIAGWLVVFCGGGYPSDLHRAADLGTALGPIATLATAAAFIIGFRSLGIQREELSLQRAELKLQREQMAASTTELARAAEAQQELTKAQRELASAQVEANRLAQLAEQAMRRSTISTLTAAIATVEVGRAQASAYFTVPQDVSQKVQRLLVGMENLANAEHTRLAEIGELDLGVGLGSQSVMALERIVGGKSEKLP